MNFEHFQVWRRQHILDGTAPIDGGETNVYGALAHLAMPVPPVDERRIYRCDLARAWLARYGYPTQWSRRALVCGGVRHALALIFDELARRGAVVWLPSDIYPVYGELARAAGIEPRTYDTLPLPLFPQEPAGSGEEVLLVANPLKPLGRYLGEDEIAALRTWLAGSPERNVIIDTVYDLDTPLHATTRALYETGQAIVLHSLTKGWLAPRTFGVALLGEHHAWLEPVFRKAAPTQLQLRRAEYALLHDADKPSQVAAELRERQRRMLDMMPEALRRARVLPSSRGIEHTYFFAVDLPAEVVLRDHGWLAVPASAFGAPHWQGSVITSLAPVFAPQGAIA
ncbi:aminotransferase class I/II-fold pyridoxal phosphate-dependent enzyme [Dyella sp.]|uniref:aminotransferase class I/II-fold pyridoxal phosphate-dependent enzyme n=1 Tax=Dyella sp. TaxID=1869338 RepID=UPI002ED537AD